MPNKHLGEYAGCMTSRPEKGTAPIPAKESRPKEVDGESLADEPKGNGLIVGGPLLPEQSARLTECEAVIGGAHDRALAAMEKAVFQSSIEIGNALLEIRNARLYRQGYNTFERYCRQRWDMSKTTANRFIQAVQVIENLTPTGVIPTHERQLRPLTKLEPEQQRKVWRIATAKNSEPPAWQVELIVQKLFHSAEEPHKEQLNEDAIQREEPPPAQAESSQTSPPGDCLSPNAVQPAADLGRDPTRLLVLRQPDHMEVAT
jgi:hypothetical protein